MRIKTLQEIPRRKAGSNAPATLLLAVLAACPTWATTSSCPSQDTSQSGCSTINDQFVNFSQFSNITVGEKISFDFNASASQGSGPFGTVMLEQEANDVKVTVTLNSALFPNIGFVNSAAKEALEFSVVGNPMLNVAFTSTGFSFPGANLTAPPFGSFMYGVHCDICGPGGSNPNPGPLIFTVGLSQGTLSVHDFVANSGGYLFASDIIANGATFDVAAAIPEPATFGLMGIALALLGLLAWRKASLG